MLGSVLSANSTNSFQSFNPESNESFGEEFWEANEEEIDLSVKKAALAFELYRKKSGLEKALFLEAIATEIESLGNELITRCMQESALP